ncbi:hypothetical protein OUZ56_018402 [Daphnia magna]|uniref:Uncharacterized protein n=1 Tax=Daphnia magna TaxID=35525 RepID=A0ABQ9Z8R0_9CRUS|nr:hypothetical protein OUZ56_018402 [Daphnia magna]
MEPFLSRFHGKAHSLVCQLNLIDHNCFSMHGFSLRGVMVWSLAELCKIALQRIFDEEEFNDIYYDHSEMDDNVSE